MTRSRAPIVLFVYNRPLHARRTLDAIERNEIAPESDLIVYSDGARDPEDREAVEEVRSLVAHPKGFKSVRIVEREANFGLARNIVGGVTDVVNRHGRGIVLEDDVVTSPHFLSYMNDALDMYAADRRVMHVSGYIDPVRKPLPETFFHQVTSCWGWGTWKDRWSLLDQDASALYRQLVERDLLYDFDLDGSGRFLPQLRMNCERRKDTWAVKWGTTVYLHRGLALHPGRTLTRNIGFDGSGENCRVHDLYANQTVTGERVIVREIPVERNARAREAIKDFYRFEGETSLIRRTAVLSRKSLGAALRVARRIALSRRDSAGTAHWKGRSLP